MIDITALVAWWGGHLGSASHCLCVSPSFSTGHSVRKSLLDLLSHWTLTRSWGHKRPRTILNDDVGHIMDTLGARPTVFWLGAAALGGTRGKTHVERMNKVKVLFV